VCFYLSVCTAVFFLLIVAALSASVGVFRWKAFVWLSIAVVLGVVSSLVVNKTSQIDFYDPMLPKYAFILLFCVDGELLFVFIKPLG